MESTRHSLLVAASTGSDSAWSELDSVYRSFIYSWLQAQGVAHHDAEDLTQDVLRVVARELSSFSHSGNTGAFRSWLRQITRHRAQGFWRAGRLRPASIGNSAVQQMIASLADQSSPLSKLWDQQHDEHVLATLLRRVDSEFAGSTIEAFRSLVFQGKSARQTAAELGLTEVAVYSAKARVLRRLRKLAVGLVEDKENSRRNSGQGALSEWVSQPDDVLPH